MAVKSLTLLFVFHLMESCPRSCPSRKLSGDTLRTMEIKDNDLPDDVVENIQIWKQSLQYPLTMRSYDVASYDEHNSRFQEYQKMVFSFKFQLHNGIQYSH